VISGADVTPVLDENTAKKFNRVFQPFEILKKYEEKKLTNRRGTSILFCGPTGMATR